MSSSSPYKVFKCAATQCEAEFAVIAFHASKYQPHPFRCPYCGKQDVMEIVSLAFTLSDVGPSKLEGTGTLKRPEWPDVQDGSRTGVVNAQQLRER